MPGLPISAVSDYDLVLRLNQLHGLLQIRHDCKAKRLINHHNMHLPPVPSYVSRSFNMVRQHMSLLVLYEPVHNQEPWLLPQKHIHCPSGLYVLMVPVKTANFTLYIGLVFGCFGCDLKINQFKQIFLKTIYYYYFIYILLDSLILPLLLTLDLYS